MKRRKILLLFCCGLLLNACSSQTIVEDPKDQTYILFATPLKEHPVWLRAKKGFLDACDEEGYKCDWIGPSTIDTTEMEEVFHMGLLQKADAIITQGVIDPNWMDKANEKQIPVILVDSDMKQSNRTAFFGKDFEEQAKLLLADIERKVGTDKKLHIAIQVAEMSFEIAQEQIQEVERVFATHPGGIEIVAVSESKSDQVRAKKEWSKIFSEYQDINVAISFAGESVESCYETTASLGISDNVLIYGVDDVESTLQLLKDRKIDGSIIAPFYDYGYETVLYLSTYFKTDTKEMNNIIPIDLQLITPETVQEYEKSLR